MPELTCELLADEEAILRNVRDLLPSEREPRWQLDVLHNPYASELKKSSALETFQWPWEKLPFVVLSLLDSLRPDRAKGQEAAVRYLNSREPTVVPVKMSIGLPLAIIMVIVIALVVMARAMV